MFILTNVLSTLAFKVLSYSMVILFMTFIMSWLEVMTLVQAIRLPFSYIMSSKKKNHSCPNSLFSWYLVQIITLLLKVYFPAYIEMNILWLNFIKSFLIATVYWFNCHKLNLRHCITCGSICQLEMLLHSTCNS